MFGIKFVRYPASVRCLCHMYLITTFKLLCIEYRLTYWISEYSYSLISLLPSAPKIPYRSGPNNLRDLASNVLLWCSASWWLCEQDNPGNSAFSVSIAQTEEFIASVDYNYHQHWSNILIKSGGFSLYMNKWETERLDALLAFVLRIEPGEFQSPASFSDQSVVNEQVFPS